MPKKTYNIIHAKRVLVSFFLVSGFLSSFLFIHTVQANSISESEVIALTNNTRVKEGLNPLISNTKLSAAAEDKAYDMLKNNYFAHTSPKGVEPWFWIKKAGYDYKYAGENLAINYTSAKEQQNAWMKSPTHRANILNAHYQEIGVATVEGEINGEVSIVTVELFGTQVLAVADQSRSVASPAIQPAEANVPEVKGTEIVASPLLAPLAPQLESVVKSDAESSFLWAETHAQTMAAILSGQVRTIQARLSEVRWNEAVRITAVIFLMFAVLLGPFAFLYKAIEVITQIVQKRDTHRGEVLVPIVLLPSPLKGIHQNIKSGSSLMCDIRPG